MAPKFLKQWQRMLRQRRSKKPVKFDKQLYKLDYLVFSAHKTATQSVVRTLRNNGFKSKHCHLLEHIGLENGSFGHYVHDCLAKNGKPLNIISIFRDPIERHMSSFFQWYGSKPINKEEVKDESGTIIYQKPVAELQAQLIDEIQSGSLTGREESIDIICEELAISPASLSFDEHGSGYGIYATDTFKLILFRFDMLVRNLDGLLSAVTGRTIRQYDANKSDAKWYRSIYDEFRETFTLPHDSIRRIYASRRNLIDLFYSDGYASKLDAAIARYGRGV